MQQFVFKIYLPNEKIKDGAAIVSSSSSSSSSVFHLKNLKHECFYND